MSKELEVLERIQSEMDHIPGYLGFYYKNLVTGQEFGVNDEEAFMAASVIKLPIYAVVMKLAAE